MREKTRHRLDVAVDFFLWSIAGVIAVLWIHFEEGIIWLGVLVGLLFFVLAIGASVSPKLRRYMRMQYLGARRFPEAESVGKYTILEDDFEKIRTACAEELYKQNPRFSFREWQRKRWDTVKDTNHPNYAWALFPGMFRDTEVEERLNRETGSSCEFCVEACVVAFWDGT